MGTGMTDRPDRLAQVRAALDAVTNARLAVDELAGLVRGQVTIGMVSGCALPVLAELLAGFRQQYPGECQPLLFSE